MTGQGLDQRLPLGLQTRQPGVELEDAGTLFKGLPAVVVDRYGSVAVVRLDGEAIAESGRIRELIRASGADDVPGTWIRHYTLLDLFLVVVVAMAVARLFGLRWAALALFGLLIACPERDAPLWAFPILLGTEALYRLLPGPRLRGLAGARRGQAARSGNMDPMIWTCLGST